MKANDLRKAMNPPEVDAEPRKPRPRTKLVEPKPLPQKPVRPTLLTPMGHDGSTPGHEALTKWFDVTRFRQIDLAAHMGVSRQMMCMWAAGARRPSMKQAARLQDMTGVLMRSWV